MKGKIVFITGGARSGKSSFALKEAIKISGHKAYIATAEALDDEMKARITKHKDERGSEWKTYEEPLKVSEIIEEIKDRYSVVVLDCLTIWLSNMICSNIDCNRKIDDLITVLENSRLKTHNSKL